MNNKYFTLLLIFTTLLSSALSDVTPDVVLEKLECGDSLHVIKRVTTPEFPKRIDLIFLEDETGSFADDIATIQGPDADCSGGLAAMVFDELNLAVDEARWGVGGFRDFPISPYGGASDFPFMFISDLSSDKDAFLAGICALSAAGGADTPESQFQALFDSVDAYSFSPDPDVTKIIILVTDAPAHNSAVEPAYPGVSEDDAIEALVNANIHPIILQAPGAFGYDNLVAATGGAIGTIDESSSNIVEAILEAIGEITADISIVLKDCDPRLKVTFDPPFIMDATMNTEYIFIESATIKSRKCCDIKEKLKCTVEFLLDGGESLGEEKLFVVPDNAHNRCKCYH